MRPILSVPIVPLRETRRIFHFICLLDQIE